MRDRLAQQKEVFRSLHFLDFTERPYIRPYTDIRDVAVPHVEANYLHGEMVAMGTLAQLAIEQREDEARRVAEFFADVGLPVHLGHLSLKSGDTESLATVAEGVVTFPFIGNMPQRVDRAVAERAMRTADSLGRAVTERKGDAAYRELHAA